MPERVDEGAQVSLALDPSLARVSDLMPKMDLHLGPGIDLVFEFDTDFFTPGKTGLTEFNMSDQKIIRIFHDHVLVKENVREAVCASVIILRLGSHFTGFIFNELNDSPSLSQRNS